MSVSSSESAGVGVRLFLAPKLQSGRSWRNLASFSGGRSEGLGGVGHTWSASSRLAKLNQ